MPCRTLLPGSLLTLCLAAACGSDQDGPSPALHLAFTTQPGPGLAGHVMPPFQVSVLDASGGPVANPVYPVTVTLGDNPSAAVLAGTRVVTAGDGIAVFSDITVSAEGRYTLVASAPELASVTSQAFDIAADIPPPTATTLAGWIVFTSTRSGMAQLHAVQPDGSDLVRISPDVIAEGPAVSSPDGQQLAFVRQVRAIVRDVVSGSETEVTALREASALVWSPDSRWLATLRGCCGVKSFPLVAARIDGSASAVLATGCNMDFGGGIAGYSWSPDATSLVYADPAAAGCFAAGPDLLTVGVDGSDTTPLTADAPWERNPRWSPAGAWIAFETFDDCSMSPCPESLETVRPDGTGRQTIAEVLPKFGARPWSPDGALIAYAAGTPDAGLYLADPETGDVRTLYAEAVAEFAWSPDGSRIAFDGQSPAGLYLVDVESGGVETVFPAAHVTGITWAPDGARLAFASGEQGAREIWVVGADGSGAMSVAGSPADDYGPVWLAGP